MARPRDKDTWRREVRKGSTQLVILAVLSKGKLYGYQVVKELRERSGGYFDLKEGTLYPALHGLEKAGFVVSEWYSPDDTPPKKYYTLTPAGKEYFNMIKKEWDLLQEKVKGILKGIEKEKEE